MPAPPRPHPRRPHGGHPMICARCDKAIQPDEEYDRITPDALSVGKPDVIRHMACPGRRAS
ncbi:hypothetical protein CLM85_01550 [Streptomyces albidoflavus]|nr:hypothetical protein CLM82_15790 [Streptomyces albidoflavus]PBO17741.1 hypothetical protein CLM83_16560 [Streptomyces albidoflavus]PBO25920.1 hypothetical protein CLM85_01550 [Streptomyces albidoflavus]PBO28264.1 hypothetical protein CLM84_21120 [Streptomyces albidoflavus]